MHLTVCSYLANFLSFFNNCSVNVNVEANISVAIVCGKSLSGKDLYLIDTSQLIYHTDQSDRLCVSFKQFVM